MPGQEPAPQVRWAAAGEEAVLARANRASSKSTQQHRSKASKKPARPLAPAVDYGGEPARPRSSPLPPPSWAGRRRAVHERERRTQPRARAEFAVRLYGGDGRDTYLEARLRSADVSLSGIFLRSSFFLPEGAPVRVEFEVPEVGAVVAKGVVRRVQREGEQSGVGIEFNDFAPGSREALVSVFVADEVRRFVERYCRERRGHHDLPSSTGLLHAILAWELHRSEVGGSAL